MRHRHEPAAPSGPKVAAIGWWMEAKVRDFLSDWRRWTFGERIAAALVAGLLAVLLPAGPLLLAIG